MNEFLSNPWTKRAASLVSVLFCVGICGLSYLSAFYEIRMVHPVSFCIVWSLLSLLFLTVMLYSRRQVLTRLSSFLLLPALFPAVLLCFGNWGLILPLVLTSLVIFFLSGSGETIKTVLGTIYLLLYVLGSLGFFLVMSLFAPSTERVVVDSGISPSGTYRYEVIDTHDSSNGSTSIHIEPNDRDIDYKLIQFIATGYDHTVYLVRPIQEESNVEWTTVSREEITKSLLQISEDLELDLNADQKRLLGISDATQPVYLKDLTDAQLELLGVPQQNDVLSYNGKVCFRSYIAVLEDYFDKSKRTVSFL